MVSLTKRMRTLPYLRREARRQRTCAHRRTRRIFSMCPVRWQLRGADLGSRQSGSRKVLRRSEYVRTRRPVVSANQLPGSSELMRLVSWFAYRPAGLLSSEAGCACMAPAMPSHASHARMIHSSHLAVIHAGHATCMPPCPCPTYCRDPSRPCSHDHAAVGLKKLPIVHQMANHARSGLGYRCTQPSCTARVPRAEQLRFHGLGKHGKYGLFAVWFDDHVVGSRPRG